MKILINKFLVQNKLSLANLQYIYQDPILPNHVKILYKSKTGSRDMYEILNTPQMAEPKMKRKWDNDLNLHIDIVTLKTIFKTCFKIVDNNSLVWLQYRLLNRILGVRKYLFDLKIDDTDSCRLCSSTSETLIHLFSECIKAQELWHCVKTEIKIKIGFDLNFNTETIILGYLNSDTNFKPINLILLVTKQYIFYCALRSKNPNFHILRNRLINNFPEQQMIAKIQFNEDNFNKVWQRWNPFFLDI